jgi:endonuclease YncB( thermonuclease family)
MAKAKLKVNTPAEIFAAKLDPSLQTIYEVNGYVFDLYDGDTVYYHAALGYNQVASFQIGRLVGINTPEINRNATKARATEAKNFLWSQIQRCALNRYEESSRIGYKLKIRSIRPENNKWFADLKMDEKEKFGRWLVKLIGADDEGQPVDLNQLMINAGYAVPMAEVM